MTVKELINELKKVPEKDVDVGVFTGDVTLMYLDHIEYHAPDPQWPDDEDPYVELCITGED